MTLHSPHLKARGVALVAAKLFAAVGAARSAVAGAARCAGTVAVGGGAEVRRLLQVDEVLRKDGGLVVAKVDPRFQLPILVEHFLRIVEAVSENDADLAKNRQRPPTRLQFAGARHPVALAFDPHFRHQGLEGRGGQFESKHSGRRSSEPPSRFGSCGRRGARL